MPRRPEIGNVQLYPNRPLHESDKNGYVLKFYCPIRNQRIRRNAGTRDRRAARSILRECRERLLNGKYIESGGAVTESTAIPEVRPTPVHVSSGGGSDRTWDECFEHYYAYAKNRLRESSLSAAASRLTIAKRILDDFQNDLGLPHENSVSNYMSLEALEYLQDRLLAGDEGRYESRSPMTVNTTLVAVMTFVRHCHRHEWIDRVPQLIKLDVDDVMKGRPITTEEFNRMVTAIPEVVGERPAPSWKFVLEILWESAFRVGDVMNFSWTDENRIHPVWPSRKSDFPTIAIPSRQKNKKAQEIPMLPGVQQLLESVPTSDRKSWVVNPRPIDYGIRTSSDSIRPTSNDLQRLVKRFNNSAIARACRVSETAVRKWLKEAAIPSDSQSRQAGDVPIDVIAKVAERANREHIQLARRSEQRLTKERVGRIITAFGEKADIIVQQADDETGRRIKYASAHDLRRGCAQRLINAGISAETLKLVLRHKNFSTTERFYGATRAAQSAAAEIHERLIVGCKKDELVGGLVGGLDHVLDLTVEERKKLKALLNSL